ncbi:MAG TPA: NAD(P)H-dependent oxidoreductase, partial [Bacteroidota bacterium]|nr:NAD(P)H-dependent oxidoreductase [Bacteroidota bacterium]
MIDLRDWQLPMYDEPISPVSNKGIYTNPIGRKWADKIGEADGYIIVTPEYNHGYPAVLKNAIDWVFQEWRRKPVGFVSYGNLGGARVIEQLRQVVIELQMLPIRNAVHIPP